MKRDILSLSQVLPLKAQNLLVSEKAKCARQGTYMHYPGSTLKSVPLCLLFKPALLWEIAFLLFVGNLCDCYSQVAQWSRICLPTREMRVRSLNQEDPLEKEMATLSSILAWKIPWTEEPGGLQSVGLHRVGQD